MLSIAIYVIHCERLRIFIFQDKMMFCDQCDRGYHTFCIGMKKIPTGRWECRTCGSAESSPSNKLDLEGLSVDTEDLVLAGTSPIRPPPRKQTGSTRK